MDSDPLDDSVFNDQENDSDAFSPEPKPKAKATVKTGASGSKSVSTKATVSKSKSSSAKSASAASKAAPKKTVQTTLKTTKAVPKKRAKPESDEGEGDDDDGSGFGGSPPSAKKQKKALTTKKKKVIEDIVEDIPEDDMMLDDDDAAASKPSTKNKTATETYQKLTQLEHIIKRPDTYIGSVERTTDSMWVYNKEANQMEYRKVGFVPGLYKIFDEILVNAADNKQRDPNMTSMKVTVNREEGKITVENNGKGIPVEMHEKENVYIPELVFGHLLAGSNFDDDEKKTTGGRNGYGAKLCNVFSTEFTLECQDAKNGKRYKQTWVDNMSKMGKASIKSSKSSDFVRVTFKPDFKRFGMEDGIDDDLEAILCRRVYDMAGTVRGVKVYLNDTHLNLNFKKYCELYAKAIASERGAEATVEPSNTVILEDSKGHPRWEIAFAVSDGSFQQVSFVNSIATTQGGTHVNYVAEQICQSLLKHLTKKRKGHTLKANHMKNHIFIFVNCLVTNPAFTSQTKEQLTTKVSQFGSKCELTDQFLKKIEKTDAITNILNFAELKADKALAKSDGNKRSRISNAKLVDANLAGTRRGHECTLILTEGDSAKSLAVAGRAILDPDRIGVFPLRGKILNVREATIDQITKNQEIQNIKQFLGLKHKQVYADTKGLRYGHLMIMTDQDHDGSHIKGLLINFLQVQYPSLLKIPDFLKEFITPVVKVWQGPNPKKPTKIQSFFSLPQYEEWKEGHKAELKKWQYKYYKGLGTSDNEDAQVYFTDLDAHMKEFGIMQTDEVDLLELAFSKTKADARKEWLSSFVHGTYLDHSSKKITYADFINKEFILFSVADNTRSIPSMIDGLKPGQRKVIYACFKRNLTKDKKVVELAGYVSEQTAYHHGEVSLQQTVVGLAQNFVGSNNVNLLEPSGNFGSRLAGGSDAASARYIFTRLSPFARKVFSPLDEPNLEHWDDDGKKIEPKVYAPVIPMILANGAEGIGTGWSTNIPNYHPLDLIKNIRRRMGRLDSSGELPFEPMVPWFRGWKGNPAPAGPYRYQFDGQAEWDEDGKTVIIKELPIRMWTDDFKAKLEEVIKAEKTPSFIRDYKEYNDHKNVHFEIAMDESATQGKLKEELLDKFKLRRQVPTSNMVAFDCHGHIRKYETIEEILEEFYLFRFKKYKERKAHWLGVLHGEYRKLSEQARFIKEIMDGDLVVNRKKKAVIVEELRARKYEPFPRNAGAKKSEDEELGNEEPDDEAETEKDSDYAYLLSMPIWSFTQERLDKLKDLVVRKLIEHDELESQTEKDLWTKDLDELEAAWEQQEALEKDVATKIRRKGARGSKKLKLGPAVAGRKGKAAADDDYAPATTKTKPAAATKAAAKPKAEKTKTAENFAAKFAGKSNVPQLDGADDMDVFSDDDYAALTSKPAKKVAAAPAPKPKAKPLKNEDSDDDVIVPAPSKRAAPPPAKAAKPIKEDSDESEELYEVEVPTRNKRAAAAPASKRYVEESDSGSNSDSDDVTEEVTAPARSKRAAPAPAPVPRSEEDDSESLEDDTAEVAASAPAPAPARGKRAAASKAKTWVIEDDDDFESSDDDDKNVGDVDALVKGIPAAAETSTGDGKSGRFSLFAMNRPGSSHSTALKALKSKPSKTFDLDESLDDTNYEMLAKSSPQRPSHTTTTTTSKSAPQAKRDEDIYDVLSDDDDDEDNFQSARDDDDDDDDVVLPKAKAATKSKTSSSKAAKETSKAAAKKPSRAAATTTTTAASKTKKPKYHDDEDDDDDRGDNDSDDDESEEDFAPKKKVVKKTSKVALSPAAKSYAKKKR